MSVIYLMNASLDGYVEGPDGTFGWTRPDEEVHRFHNEMAREMSAFLYGRRMYETMAGWQTMDKDPAFRARTMMSSMPDVVLEFARIWQQKPKIVFSTTLREVGPNCRLVRGDIAAELARLKLQHGGDLGVGGPGLASSFARLGLIDEYRLVAYPILIGGGKPYFPAIDRSVSLRLLETRTFGCGAVYLRYRAGEET